MTTQQFEKKVADLEASIKAAEERATAAEAKVDELKSERDAAQSARDAALKERDTAQTEAKTLRGNVAELTTERDQLKADAKTVEEAVAAQIATLGVKPAADAGSSGSGNPSDETPLAKARARYDELQASGKSYEAGLVWSRDIKPNL